MSIPPYGAMSLCLNRNQDTPKYPLTSTDGHLKKENDDEPMDLHGYQWLLSIDSHGLFING